MELNGKTIIITGASSGIGAAAARLFVAEGANVVLAARRQANLDALVDEIAGMNAGGKAVALAGDVREEACHAGLVALARDRFGGLDGAFNNAGIMGETGSVIEMSPETWDDVLASNLTSAWLAARHQIPAMRDGGGGALVFTSSFVGNANAGLPGMGAYAASKAGLVGLVKSLAAEHAGDGIRVNALLPGGTKTPMAGDDPAAHEYFAGLHPMGRIADPVEIAQAALFLLSDRASFVTGSPVSADGGISVRI